MAEAQRTVNENLRLDAGVAAYEFYLLEAQLPCKYNAGDTHFRRRFNAGKIVHAHLGAAVKGNIRQGASDNGNKADVLNNDAVGPGVAGKSGSAQSLLRLPVADKGIEGDIYLAAAHMAIAHSLFKFLVGEVFCAAAGVEVAKPQINRVGAVLNGGNNGFG